MPLYAIYPRLLAKDNDTWFDRILNDRALYSGTDQNPRNTLEFYFSEGEYGVFFSLLEVNIQGSTWNLKHGFKYCLEDQNYHMITELDCIDHDFEDIGLVYEITTSPQSDNTPYRPTQFVLQNGMESVVHSAQKAWNAGQYLEDFISQVDIISENNEQFSFSFDDMELAGFTEKLLELHNQEMPDGSVRKVLCAGMYGFGAYTQGSRIEIDPTFTCSTDDWDLYEVIESSYFQKNSAYMRLGHYYRDMPWPDPDIDCSYRAWCAFDTDIAVEIEEISSITFKLYVLYEAMESGEGASVYVYNIGNNFNSGSCKESSTSWALGTNSYESGVFDLSSTGWRTGDSTKMYNLLDDWRTSRNNDEDMISIHLVNYLTDSGTVDYACVDESTSSHDPELSFSYKMDYDYWALIVAGSMGEENLRFMHDALNMFNTLIDTYDGFTNDSIYLLTPNATDDVSDDPIPRDRPTSAANVEWAIDRIAAFADSTDQVFIFWVSHGNTDILECENNFDNDYIEADDLAEALDAITCNEMFIIIDACHSGSLINNLNGSANRAIYTSANSTAVSYGYEGQGYGYGNWFANATYYALDPDLAATEADDNSDDRISLFEMWDFAYDYVMSQNSYWGFPVLGYPEQRPQRWVGASIGNDNLHYIYDGYYQ